jgi:hypothetical protein
MKVCAEEGEESQAVNRLNMSSHRVPGGPAYILSLRPVSTRTKEVRAGELLLAVGQSRHTAEQNMEARRFKDRMIGVPSDQRAESGRTFDITA